MTSREEVARKLREIGEEMDDIEDCYETAFEEIDSIIYNGGYENVFQRLADIIDPTCEVVGVPDNEEFMIRVVSGFTCKKCGHTALVNRDCGKWEDPLNYCPNCGARVVNDVPDAEA